MSRTRSRTMLRTGLSRVGSSFKWQPQDGWRITSGSPSEEDNIPQSHAAKTTSRPPAAALRWSAQANSAYGFKLALQALPASARTLRKDARLAKDITKAVELTHWTATSPMAKEGVGCGPVPIVFSPDSAATRENLTAHPERLYTGKSLKNFEGNFFFHNLQGKKLVF